MKLKSFFKNNNDFLRNVVISTFIGIAASFFNYYFNILLARNLPGEDFGIYSSALGIISLIQIPSLAISSAVTKIIAENRGENLQEFKKNLFMKFFIIAIIFSVAFYLISPFISKISSIPQSYFVPLTIVLFLSFFNPLTKGILFGLEKPNQGNLLNLIEAFLKILIGILALEIFKDGATLPILAHGLPLVITGILIYPFIGRSEEGESMKKDINLKNVFTYFLLFVFLSTPYTLDLALVNPDFKAGYSALSLIGKIVYFASIMISSVMFSKVTNLKNPREKKKIFSISIGITLLIGTVLSIIYWVIPDIMNHAVYGDKYVEIIPYLGIYGLGMTFYASTYLIYNYFIAEGFTKSTYWLIIVTVIQVGLFSFRNNSLKQIVQNQFVLYVILFIGSILLLLIHNHLKAKNMDDTGIEPVTPTM